jgi:hypothetical protein
MYSLNMPVSALRTKIRQEFERHRYVKQVTVVDVLLFQSHSEFQVRWLRLERLRRGRIVLMRGLGNAQLLEAAPAHPQIFQARGGPRCKTPAELHFWILGGRFSTHPAVCPLLTPSGPQLNIIDLAPTVHILLNLDHTHKFSYRDAVPYSPLDYSASAASALPYVCPCLPMSASSPNSQIIPASASRPPHGCLVPDQSSICLAANSSRAVVNVSATTSHRSIRSLKPFSNASTAVVPSVPISPALRTHTG